MGWNLASVLVNSPKRINHIELLNNLGFYSLKRLEDEPYETAMYPDSDKVYIGYFKNNLIIVAENLPFEFYNNSLSKIENIFIDYFPESEIGAVSLQSAINHFGFALIKDGNKIRTKSGDAELGTVIDWGEPLDQERNLLAKSKLNEDGQREYYFEEDSELPYLENQVGENFVFEIFNRFTGTSFDEDDELLNTYFEAYSFSENSPTIDNDFSGEWNGQYTLGDGYKSPLKGKTESFTLNLSITDITINGLCIDNQYCPKYLIQQKRTLAILSYRAILFIF